MCAQETTSTNANQLCSRELRYTSAWTVEVPDVLIHGRAGQNWIPSFRNLTRTCMSHAVRLLRTRTCYMCFPLPRMLFSSRRRHFKHFSKTSSSSALGLRTQMRFSCAALLSVTMCHDVIRYYNTFAYFVFYNYCRNMLDYKSPLFLIFNTL